MKNKKYIMYIVVMIVIVSLGVSYAYFSTIIKGEGTPMTFKATELKIVFTDSASLVASSIEPGWSDTKVFSVKNESDSDYQYNIVMKNLVNTFVTEGYLQYKITSETGYEMDSYLDIPKIETPTDVVLAYNINIKPGITQIYTIEFIYRETEEDQSEDMGKQLSGTLAITKGTVNPNTLYNKLIADNPTILTRTDFDAPFTDTNTGTLYKATGNQTENGKDVYYFAGNAQNNWVKFGRDQEDNELYWRIIRTNEDGGIRLLYIGPDPTTEKAFIKLDGVYMSGGSPETGMYNDNYDNTMYVGYMYGTEGSLENNRQNTTSSPIKLKTDEWYSKTINVNTDTAGNIYDKYVSETAIYCNDRSGNEYISSGLMFYSTYNRLVNNKRPSYKCGSNESGNIYGDANDADKFTKSTITGNGKLQYPIAQITADEIAFVGGVYGSHTPTWYYYNSIGDSAVGSDYWWTMTSFIADSHNSAHIFTVDGKDYTGRLANDYVALSTPGIRPVLSLKSCVEWESGNGSSENPYKVKLSKTCSNLEN